MFNFVSRDTMILIAVLVSLVASYYLYSEIKRQQGDMETIKNYVSHKLARSPTNEVKKQPKKQPVEEVEEVEEEEDD